MIIPCLDLMGGKVVQLVRGRDKALELDSVAEALALFEAFPLIHVIDLDAALGQGSNGPMILDVVKAKRVRVGGGVRSVDRAKELLDLGAEQVIVGTRAFQADGINHEFLRALNQVVPPDRLILAIDSKRGHVAVKGWHESVALTPEQAVSELKPYCAGFLCTYVDREGTMEGTDLDLFLRLRKRTTKSLIAAGGIATVDEVRTLVSADIEVALGMAVYTRRLNLAELADIENSR